MIAAAAAAAAAAAVVDVVVVAAAAAAADADADAAAAAAVAQIRPHCPLTCRHCCKCSCFPKNYCRLILGYCPFADCIGSSCSGCAYRISLLRQKRHI